MAHPIHDLTGMRFGRLTVIERGPDYVHETMRPYMKPEAKRIARWWCRCDCGNTALVIRNNLISGASTSCGCKRREHMRELHRKHREAKGCV